MVKDNLARKSATAEKEGTVEMTVLKPNDNNLKHKKDKCHRRRPPNAFRR